MNLCCFTALVAVLMVLTAHDEQRKRRRAIFIDQGFVTTVDQRPAHASAEIFFIAKEGN